MSQELPGGVELRAAMPLLHELVNIIQNAEFGNMRKAEECYRAILADREKQAARVPCSACAGSGWVVRDPDIGTDQECFVCEGKGTAPTEPSKPERAEGSGCRHGIAGYCTECNRHKEMAELRSLAAIATAPPASAAGERDVWLGGSNYEASMLRNLLARIHGDGGHYLERNGLEKTMEDADQLVSNWRAALASKPLPEQVAQDSKLLAWIEKVGSVHIQRVRAGFKGPIRWDIEYGPHEDEARGDTLEAAIDAARTRGEGGGT